MMEVDRKAPLANGGRPPALRRDAHKGDAGRVLVIAGCREMPGAAILATRAALRGGAGLVTLACVDSELLLVAPGAVPEALLWDLTHGDTGGHEGYGALRAALAEGLLQRKFDVILMGPGMGDSKRTASLLDVVFNAWGGPLLLDADALNALGRDPELRAKLRGRRGRTDRPAALRKGRESYTVLTPHPGEALRLLGPLAAESAAGTIGSEEDTRLRVAGEIARDLQATVCLKGAGTVTTDGVRFAVNPTGNPGMATAGAGDVLAGLAAAFMTQVCGSFSQLAAARAAVFVHGYAGDLAAAEVGLRAVIASDLVERLGRAEERAPWGGGNPEHIPAKP